MSAESQAVAETLWDTSLRSDAQWRTWIAKVEAAATKGNVWHYMNPNLSEDEVRKAPVDSRDSYPHPREISDDASDVSQLSETEYKKYQRLTSEFDKETSWNESIRTKINKVDALIDANVAPEHRHILQGKVTPYEKLVRLKQQFEPKGDTSRQSVRNAWRDLVRRPIGRISIDKWLATWSNLYEEGKAMNIPDIAYHDDKGNPQDRDAIRDFLQAVESFDEVFVSLWRKDIMNKDFKISFQDMLAAYRNHRNAKGVAKSLGNSSSIAFAATLNGPQEGQISTQGSQNTQNSRKPQSTCVCGSLRHHWKNCYYLNVSRRPSGWKPHEAATKRIEENMKKLSIEEQKEISKLMKDNHNKTAQLALTQADNVSTETLIFFTVSPFVFKTALIHPLASCWIIDSGANTHISNQRDRFITFTKEEREVVLGSGKAIAQGRGTARICVNQPGGGTIWVHLKNVWYVPGFQTNVISVSEIKKNGFFFNSEVPAITRQGTSVAMCTERFGLYLLDEGQPPYAFATVKTSAKPLVSVATPRIWHRRVGHLYDKRIELLAKMVDGVEIRTDNDDSALSNPELCETCQTSKAKRQISRRPADRGYIHRKFGRIHFDLVHIKDGYNSHQWLSHLYVEGIRLHMAQTHEKKNGCIQAIQAFIAICRTQLKMNINVFKSDREPTLGNDFMEYCRREGLIVEFSVVRTPEQNGFIERAGGIIVTTARALIADSGLPKNLWPEAVAAAVYLINRMPTRMPDGRYIIPWVEAMQHRDPSQDLRPNLSNLRLYGCRAYVMRRGIAKTDKMAPRAEIGYLVGYVASNIWKIWLPQLNQVREFRDVVFDENVRFNPAELHTPVAPAIHDAAFWNTEIEESESRRPRNNLDEFSLESDTTRTEQLRKPSKSLSKELRNASATDQCENDHNARVMERTPPPIMTPSPTPTPAALSNEIPGAFPTESHPIRHEPEGVGHTSDPEQQLHTELSGTLQPTLPSNPPPGYRLRGELAPRNIDSSFSRSNIIEGKRKRAHFAAIEEPVESTELIEEDEIHDGVLVAFTAGLTQQKPHREDLPPEPKTWSEMLRHPHRDGFIHAASVEVKGLESKSTFREVDKPNDKGLQILPLTWVFTYKFDSDGYLVKYKARICVRGDLQKLSTEEKYSATLAVRTARAIFAFAANFDLDIRQYDAVNAFLNSKLEDDEEVYVELPPGMFPKGRRCWKLQRALYGLRKSPRMWQREASRVLTALGFKVVQEDLCMFVRNSIIVVFYVDDILIVSPRDARKEADDVAKDLSDAWELRSMEEAQWFLGIRILRDRQKGVIWLCQDAYISAMAHRYHLTQERRIDTPPVSIATLKPYNGTASDAQKHEYMSKVGSAQFPAIVTRPDVAKATAHLAQFLANPSPEHIHAINSIIVFLYHTRMRAICFKKQPIPPEPSVQFFSDASFGDNPDRKSSAGYICMIFGGPVDWKASKQKTVTTSTTEAELLALSEAGKSLLMWKRLFNAVKFNPGHPVALQCDNQQTIGLLTKELPQLHTKLRHIDIHQHWLRQEVRARRIPIQWVKTSEMVADGLTKLLPRQKHLEFVKLLGMEDVGHLVDGLE